MPTKLGRGLDALLSRSDDGSARRAELRAKLSRMDGEYHDLKDRTSTLRKKLTMEIVLGGNPDMTELRSMEGRMLDLELARKEVLDELPDLIKERDTPKQGQPPEKRKRSSEIDTEMIRIMISETKATDARSAPAETTEDSLGMETDEILRDLRSLQEDHANLEAPQEAAPVVEQERSVDAGRTERRVDDVVIIESIKDEIHPKAVVRRIKEENSQSVSRSSRPNVPVMVRKLSSPSPQESAFVRKKVVRKVKQALAPPSGSKVELSDILLRTSRMIEEGDFDGALPILEKSIGKFGPEGDESLLCQVGTLYFEKGDLDKANEKFRAVVRGNPLNARAINNLGIILKKQKRFEESIRIINQAIELDPNYERAWYELGCVFMEIQPPLLKEASIFLRRALEIDPGFERAREKLKECSDMMHP